MSPAGAPSIRLNPELCRRPSPAGLLRTPLILVRLLGLGIADPTSLVRLVNVVRRGVGVTASFRSENTEVSLASESTVPSYP